MNYSPLILATLVVYVSLLTAGVQPAVASNNVQSYIDPEPISSTPAPSAAQPFQPYQPFIKLARRDTADDEKLVRLCT